MGRILTAEIGAALVISVQNGSVTELGDAVDRILLREAGPALASARTVAIVDDETGALRAGVASAGNLDGPTGPPDPGRIRCYDDSARIERAHPVVVALDGCSITRHAELAGELFDAAEVVLLRLPKGLAALAEIAAAAAIRSDPSVQLFAAGRVKHLSRGMNEVLAGHFGSVRASLGQQKSRALLAADPRRGAAPPGPRIVRHDLRLTVHSYGGAFAGGEVDRGTRLLLSCYDRLPGSARTVLDFGSGTGVLGVAAALRLPTAGLVAVDDSRAAVRSTLATAAANGIGDRVSVRHADRLRSVPDASVELVVCNPPFHQGTARDSSMAYEMFTDAARVLSAGGELWVVFNSHLPYLNALRRTVGRTTVLAQDRSFTVTRSVRPLGRRPPSAATA